MCKSIAIERQKILELLPTLQPISYNLSQMSYSLLHLQTTTSLEIPPDLTVISIGKPSDSHQPNIDVSGFPNVGVVSRFHASIYKEGENYYIEDVGSANGTYINNNDLPRGCRHLLCPGDTIALGKDNLVTFIFQASVENINPGSVETDNNSEPLPEPDELKSPEAKAQPKNDPAVIISFLESRGIKIKTVPAEEPSADVINSLSKYLGENYDSLRELLAIVKRKMQQGAQFSLPIKKYAQKDIANICNFCTRLYNVAFLEEYKYYKSPQYLIKAKTTTLPTAQNFFSGTWLERFVLQVVQKCVKHSELSYLLNPSIILPNGDDFELDLIFSVGDCFYWIEAKSGDYQQHISKYSKVAKLLNLDSAHSIMVLPDIAENSCAELTSLFSMTVCPLSRLEAILLETLRKDQAA